jgi:hypothetical protein
MEDNHCLIMDIYPSNQLIARIQMKNNIMFSLTLKLAKKKNTTLAIGKAKDAQLDTAFKVESAHSSNG